MTFNEAAKNEIIRIMESVIWGKITFHFNPERDTLNYNIETSDKIYLKGETEKKGSIVKKSVVKKS